MASQIDPRGGTVVELGAGTGVITKALLDTGLPPEHLVVIERNPVFCRLLLERFPRIHIFQADARQAHTLLEPSALAPVQAVVSGLPLLGFPVAVQRQILLSSLALLKPPACFVQFTYGLVSPVPQGLIQDLSLRGRRVRTVWRNLPPARIWRYSPQIDRRRQVEPLAA